MQSTPSLAAQTKPAPNRAATSTLESGFQSIPTRMQDLAPLVVAPTAEVETQVQEQLENLELQIATVHAFAAEAYVSQAKYDKARAHIEVAVTFAPDDVRYQNQCGYLRYLTGDDASAIQAFQRVVEQIPTQVDALCNLGMVHFGLEDYAQAKQWFALAVRQSPDDAEIWNNLGASIHQLGQPQEAAQYFRKALELDPQNADAKANLASC